LIELWQLAQLGRQPFELIVADLKHGLESDHEQINRISHVEVLELRQLADFCWQRREQVFVDLKAKARDAGSDCDMSATSVPHFETLQIGQQTELRRKRPELVRGDLKTTCLWSNRARSL
jgi:hypothetical protein